MLKHKYIKTEKQLHIIDEWVEGGHSTRRTYAYKPVYIRQCDSREYPAGLNHNKGTKRKCKKCYDKA